MQSLNLTDTRRVLHDLPQAGLYLSMPDCGVCHSIKPQVRALGERLGVPFFELDAAGEPGVASVFEVMTVPAVLLFANGKEYHRQARFIRLDELERRLKQPPQAVDYQQIFAKNGATP